MGIADWLPVGWGSLPQVLAHELSGVHQGSAPVTKHLLLVDCSGLFYRAHFALPPTARSDGFPTHAILGFVSILWSLIGRAEADPFDFAGAVFDAPGKTFRHKLFPQYKAQRKRPEALTQQMPFMREAAYTLGLEPVELMGWEADDILATLAFMAREGGWRTTVVAVDKDLLQIVEDGVAEVVDPVQRKRLYEKDVVKKFGVPPCLVADVQALAGDASDNYPGIQGIGPKNAAGLIRAFGSLEGVIKEAKAGRQTITYAMRKAIVRGEKDLRIYRKLATLRIDVPLGGKDGFVFETLKPRPVSRAHLKDLLRVLEADARYNNLFGEIDRRLKIVAPDPDPLAWWRKVVPPPGKLPDTGRLPDVPQCGFYKRRLTKGGAWVPARIWRDPEKDFITRKTTGKEVIRCEVDGRDEDPHSQWAYLFSQPISESDFNFMVNDAEWARKHKPKDPAAANREPINWNDVEL